MNRNVGVVVGVVLGMRVGNSVGVCDGLGEGGLTVGVSVGVQVPRPETISSSCLTSRSALLYSAAIVACPCPIMHTSLMHSAVIPPATAHALCAEAFKVQNECDSNFLPTCSRYPFLDYYEQGLRSV